MIDALGLLGGLALGHKEIHDVPLLQRLLCDF
jgi:hypothetical protein